MSLVLRHQPEYINLQLDENGWAQVDDLITGINKKGVRLDRPLLEEVVKQNDKQRFIISDDGLRIRANQGHSINIDLALTPVEPPAFLFHGTVSKFMNAIKKEGLLKMTRQHVHLSEEMETAVNVGGRRGKPIVLTVRTGEMHKDGVEFFQSKNGVWLTDHVAPNYIDFE